MCDPPHSLYSNMDGYSIYFTIRILYGSGTILSSLFLAFTHSLIAMMRKCWHSLYQMLWNLYLMVVRCLPYRRKRDGFWFQTKKTTYRFVLVAPLWSVYPFHTVVCRSRSKPHTRGRHQRKIPHTTRYISHTRKTSFFLLRKISEFYCKLIKQNRL